MTPSTSPVTPPSVTGVPSSASTAAPDGSPRLGSGVPGGLGAPGWSPKGSKPLMRIRLCPVPVWNFAVSMPRETRSKRWIRASRSASETLKPGSHRRRTRVRATTTITASLSPLQGTHPSRIYDVRLRVSHALAVGPAASGHDRIGRVQADPHEVARFVSNREGIRASDVFQ